MHEYLFDIVRQHPAPAAPEAVNLQFIYNEFSETIRGRENQFRFPALETPRQPYLIRLSCHCLHHLPFS
jgi:hypothetical protein